MGSPVGTTNTVNRSVAATGGEVEGARQPTDAAGSQEVTGTPGDDSVYEGTGARHTTENPQQPANGLQTPGTGQPSQGEPAEEGGWFSNAMGLVRQANDSPIVQGGLALAAVTPIGSGAGLALSLAQLVDEISDKDKPISWGNVLAMPFLAAGMFIPGLGAIGQLFKFAGAINKSNAQGSQRPPPDSTNDTTATTGAPRDARTDQIRGEQTEGAEGPERQTPQSVETEEARTTPDQPRQTDAEDAGDS